MIVPILEGGTIVEDEIVSVEHVRHRGPIYDLNVDLLHNYVADGVVVHNCIYGWRGADPSLLLDFPQQYPGARVFPLDQNHPVNGCCRRVE
jgi:DNA helicase-2/ATP-dependent DNA helicase PcrA